MSCLPSCDVPVKVSFSLFLEMVEVPSPPPFSSSFIIAFFSQLYIVKMGLRISSTPFLYV